MGVGWASIRRSDQMGFSCASPHSSPEPMLRKRRLVALRCQVLARILPPSVGVCHTDGWKGGVRFMFEDDGASGLRHPHNFLVCSRDENWRCAAKPAGIGALAS